MDIINLRWRNRPIDFNNKGEESTVGFVSVYSDETDGSIGRLAKDTKAHLYTVYLAKDTDESADFLKVKNRIYAKTHEGSEVEFLSYERFIEKIFGISEASAFRKEMKGIENDINNLMLFELTEICDERTLKTFRSKLLLDLSTFDYDSIKHEDVIGSQLNENEYHIIKKNYIEKERYKIMVGNTDFATAFITSEWLYQKYPRASDQIDNTFRVSGYLKSVEMLLWNLLYIVAQGRFIGNRRISEDPEESIECSLGDLIRFFSSENVDLISKAFGSDSNFVIRLLRNQIDDWRREFRNGFFHKDNLSNPVHIDTIRKQAFWMYMIILGSIELSDEQYIEILG